MKPFYVSLFCCLLIASFSVSQEVITLPKWDTEPVELTQLNSEQRDVNLSITPNGRYLYFMTGRGQMPWSNMNYTTFRGKSEGDGDIWYSQRIDGVWQPPVCIGRPVCTRMGEDEPQISADGQTVYFQSWKSDWATTEGPYYKAELRGNQWGQPKGMGGGIAHFFRRTVFATDGMSVSPDGKTFVVAAGPDYDGKMDLFISRKQADGAWGPLLRLDISTPEDERSVFIGADNKTLYFGSAGWGGFGKLDIFKTTLEGGTRCGDIINIGKPFNTNAEDYGFVMDVIRNDVYFVRNSDIYYAHLGDQADERIKPDPVVVIDGVVRDSSGESREAVIEIRSLETLDVVAKARSNSISGEYSLSFPKKEGSYEQSIRFHPDYEIKQEIIIDSKTPALLEMEVLADPEKVEPGKVIEPEPAPAPKPALAEKELFRVVYFEFDRSDLSEASRVILEGLTDQLTNAEEVRWELTGHTDGIGTASYNQILSEKRVQEVAKWLRGKGFDRQVEVGAKGELEPVEENDTAPHRAKNRRVEVRVRYLDR